MLKNYDELADVSEVYKFVVCLLFGREGFGENRVPKIGRDLELSLRLGLVKVTCGKISKKSTMMCMTYIIARCQMVFVFEDI